MCSYEQRLFHLLISQGFIKLRVLQFNIKAANECHSSMHIHVISTLPLQNCHLCHTYYIVTSLYTYCPTMECVKENNLKPNMHELSSGTVYAPSLTYYNALRLHSI